MTADLALVKALRDALDACFEKRPGRLGVRHLRDCRLGSRIAMSDDRESAACVFARVALAVYDARSREEGA